MDDPNPSDLHLLDRNARHGDEAAFAEVVRRHLNLVHAAALRQARSPQLAEEAASTAFQELARAAPRLAPGTVVPAWLYAITRRIALNTLRGEARRRLREQAAHELATMNATAADWNAIAPLLDDAMQALDETDRAAVLLRYFENKPLREVGMALGTGEDAAQKRVSRATERLREWFAARGVATTAAMLALTLGANASAPAPAGLAASIAAKSLAVAAGAASGAKTFLTAKWLAGVAAVVAVALIFLRPTKPAGPVATAPSSASIPTAAPINPTVAALPPDPLPPPPAPPPIPPAPPMNTATLAAAALLPVAALAADYESAAQSTNQTGLDLFHLVASADPNANALISPYSIQSALAMTYAGADGETRAEMARVLHYPADDATLAASFKELSAGLDAAVTKSAQTVAARRGRQGGAAAPVQPIDWHVANRLFGQPGYEFRQPFLELVHGAYGAPFQPLDFRADPESARLFINQWVAEQTKQKILDLLPSRTLGEATRLVLVNALYLKAPWETSFRIQSTQYQPFKVRGTTPVDVPTMRQNERLGYAKRKGFTAVTLPYLGRDLQFLILLPDDPAGVDALAAAITPAALRENAQLETQQISLSLPKFKLQGPSIELSANLKLLGMKTAFNEPTGSANFDRMAPRKPADYLFISNVIHKTFIVLDEEGTEAAAATAVVMQGGGAPRSTEVHVDHPFLFAIQHRESGMCLFLGRVTDPQWPAGPGAVAPRQRPGDSLPGF